MNAKTAKRSAIEAALPNVATVLCALITEYAQTAPHRFTIQKNGKPLTQIAIDGRTCRLQHTDTGSISDDWHSFVSDVGFQAGARRWTVDRPFDEYGWSGAGITTRSANQIIKYQPGETNIATADSWIIRGGKFVYHDNRCDGAVFRPCAASTPAFSSKNDQSDFETYEFVADPTTLQVSANAGGQRCVLMTARSIAEFYLLRPCVVLSGRVGATVVSAADE